MKSPTPEELAESEQAAVEPPQASASGRQAAVTAVLLLIGIVALAFLRPRLAGTIGVLAAIIAMIMLHELGHFVMAKRAGMKVTEFFLGFGPRLWSFRRGETEYGVKAIPAGGYVRIIGMSNVDVVDPADEDRTYRAKPYRDRLGVAVAGSTMHFLIAAILLFIVFAGVGLPGVRPVVQQIVPDSPAQ
ncbi:MAG TPA: site-2 protease family protein, partial [Acidimicrobiia bacterium]|nr:site-2 protease family protein [Acidimicrobiia bacterium]